MFGIFNRPGAETLNRDASDDRWFTGISRPTAAGRTVTPETALQLPVVWDCLNALSDSAAGLPLVAFERLSNGVRRSIDNHPIRRIFLEDFELRKQMVWDLATTGNFFAEIERSNLAVTSIRWMPPENVTVQRLPNGMIRYRFHDEVGRTRTLVGEEVWHIRRPPLIDAGLLGMSPIATGREAIAAALALQDYAARFFANDCTPPFVLEHPGNFKDVQSKGNFLNAIKRWWGGGNRHGPAMLEYGIKLNRVGVNNEEAQFLETRKELDYGLTRIWRMPPHKVGLMDKATFSNIEQQALEFVVDVLLPWLTMIERAIRRDLIGLNAGVDVEHNVTGQLRGDVKARFEAYAQARNWGWLSVNDIRQLENMNPITNGDIYLQPMNMTPAGIPAENPSAQILDGDGRPVSSLNGDLWARRDGSTSPVKFENVVDIEDFRHAA